jgi:hypothetical protein
MRNRLGTAVVLRWVARLLSLLVIGFLLLFIVGEGPPPLDLKHLCFPFGLMLGLAIAWRLEWVGSAIVVLSAASFYAFEYYSVGKFPKGPWILILAAPAAFFMLSRIPHAADASGPNKESR